MSIDTLEKPVERYWRVRSRDANRVDRGVDFWTRREIGIWYGGWTATDWLAVADKSDRDIAEYLSSLPRQIACSWPVPSRYVQTMRRFASITADDWVVGYYGGSIHLGRLDGPVQSSLDHPLNCGKEVFKFRRLQERKSFPLSELPDSYRLIPSAGRSNVHQYHGTTLNLIRWLAASSNSNEVAERVAETPVGEWLDLLGPSEWESVCLGFLIEKEGYLPTGLSVGRTLPELDIVGTSRHSGWKILAQCKKSPYPENISPEFMEMCEPLQSKGHIYYFAYSGFKETIPGWIQPITKDDMLAWLASDSGLSYMHLWRGEASRRYADQRPLNPLSPGADPNQ
jgi:hypothetical protein